MTEVNLTFDITINLDVFTNPVETDEWEQIEEVSDQVHEILLEEFEITEFTVRDWQFHT